MANSRTPNNLLKLAGTFREDRHGESGTSLDDCDGLGELPPPPDFLTDVGITEWYRISVILRTADLLKGTDFGIMIAYCKLFQMIANGDADKTASIYTQFRGVANDLGLTPVSRSKIIVGDKKPKKDNPYSDL